MYYMKNPFKGKKGSIVYAFKVYSDDPAENLRLYNLEQERLTKERSANIQSEIEKICKLRLLQGDKQVFKDDEEFKFAGYDILAEYEASGAELCWFDSLVENSPFPK